MSELTTTTPERSAPRGWGAGVLLWALIPLLLLGALLAMLVVTGAGLGASAQSDSGGADQWRGRSGDDRAGAGR